MRVVQPRVGQLDASLLDADLTNQLKDILWKAFSVYRPELRDKYEYELLLLLKLLLFKVTVWDYSTTYGAKLQNLQLVQASSTFHNQRQLTSRQKLLYGIMTIGGSYIWAKLDDYVTTAAVDSPSVRLLRRVQILFWRCWTACTLFNFVAFLFSGNYLTLVMRVLRIKYMLAGRNTVRTVNYEFQNRQLVWNALTEFLLFVLPLINVTRLRQKLAQMFTTPPKDGGRLSFLPEKTCAICFDQDDGPSSAHVHMKTVTNPYVANCGHIYCYVCIKTKLAEYPDGWFCLRCGQAIRKTSPLAPEKN